MKYLPKYDWRTSGVAGATEPWWFSVVVIVLVPNKICELKSVYIYP